ncbi:MAG: hypothetical protein QNK92_09400 [Amylibacter sp.]
MVDAFIFQGSANVQAGKFSETVRNLSTSADDPRFFMSVINVESGLIKLPATTPANAVGGSISPVNTNAKNPPVPLKGGMEPTDSSYAKALERLETQRQIDMVIASNRITAATDATELNSAFISHCESMSRKAANRIGLGQIPPHGPSRYRGRQSHGPSTHL